MNPLRRDISLPGAVMLGLGSIVGTGVFVSVGISAGVAGAGVLVAVFLASVVAICNGLSSAQLASNHPVSGGTYEYGHRWLSPTIGYSAGWMFLCAKSASAATAALGFASYLQSSIGFTHASTITSVLIAFTTLASVTVLVLLRIQRASQINSVIVGTALGALAVFAVCGMGPAISKAEMNILSTVNVGTSGYGLLQATALMFVAYTGYGRIATLGEEVKNPRRTIPIAMVATLLTTMMLYLVVTFVAVANVGPAQLSDSVGNWDGPLLYVARDLGIPLLPQILTAGALLATVGVMLNLLLGLSRVVLAMSRRTDMPGWFSHVTSQGTPSRATLLVAAIIGGLICIGNLRISWSFSAANVLIYYSLTNLCAIRMDPTERIFPIWPAWFGLASCLGLACFIEPDVLAASVAALVVGFTWRAGVRAVNHSRSR